MKKIKDKQLSDFLDAKRFWIDVLCTSDINDFH